MASEKKWTPEQRVAAARIIVSGQKGDPRKGTSWASAEQLMAAEWGHVRASVLIALQCELTTKDAELAEAVELLRESCYSGSYADDEASEYMKYKREWLKRNTPQEGEAK